MRKIERQIVSVEVSSSLRLSLLYRDSLTPDGPELWIHLPSGDKVEPLVGRARLEIPYDVAP
jgi:hypothetical protein